MAGQTVAVRPQDTLIRATTAQRRFLASRAPNVVLQGGARSGKTWAGVLKALLLLRQSGSTGMYVSPTYSQLEQAALPHMQMLAAQMGIAAVWRIRLTPGMGRIDLPGGGTMLLRSADNPQTLLGATLGWAVADELGLWRRMAYDYLQDRLSDPEGPRQFAATFTPKGRTWVYEVLGQPREGLEIIHTTPFDNPTLPADYFARLRREHGEGSRYWQQEVMGEYVSWEGLVYEAFDIERHVHPYPPDARPVTTVVGVDWGWSNPGVMTVLPLMADDVLWAAEEAVEKERPVEWWAAKGHEILRRYPTIRSFECDPSEPANIEALVRAGLPAVAANNSVLPGIMAVAGRLPADRPRGAPRCVNLVRELGLYSYKTRSDGTSRKDEPAKEDDHSADSVRYGAISYELPRPQRVRIRLADRYTI